MNRLFIHPTQFAAAALALSITACNTPAPAPAESAAPDRTALTAQVQSMEDAYATAAAAKDVDAIMAYYADDVVSYRHEMAPVSGKAALRA